MSSLRPEELADDDVFADLPRSEEADERLDGNDDGIHVIDSDDIDRDGEDDPPPPEDADREDELFLPALSELEDLMNGFEEAFNARDLESLLELLHDDVDAPGLGGDRGGFERAVTELWMRCPNAILTRGALERRLVSILWNVSDADTWVRTALVIYDEVDENLALGFVELIEDDLSLEEAVGDEPEHDLAEGSTWEEWYEGADSP